MERRMIILRDDSCEVTIAVDGTIYLKPLKGRYRIIGTYDFRNTIKRRKRQYQVFTSLNAISYPYILISYLLEKVQGRKIILEVEGIGRAEVTSISPFRVLWFKEKGYERQIFIPLKKFQK